MTVLLIFATLLGAAYFASPLMRNIRRSVVTWRTPTVNGNPFLGYVIITTRHGIIHRTYQAQILRNDGKLLWLGQSEASELISHGQAQKTARMIRAEHARLGHSPL